MSEIKKGDLVVDRWWPEFGNGLVTVVRKSYIRVLFGRESKKYDKPHCQFLDVIEKAKERNKRLSAIAKTI